MEQENRSKENVISYVGAKAILIKNKSEVLIVKENWSQKWGMPGGRIQESEIDIPITETLFREVREELGCIDLIVGEYFDSMIRVLGRPKNLSVKHAFAVFFVCDFLEGEIKLQDEELLEYAWVNKEDYENYEYISGYEKILNKFFNT